MNTEEQQEKVKVLLHLPKKLVEQVHEHAKKNFRTMSGEAQLAIQKHVDAEEKHA